MGRYGARGVFGTLALAATVFIAVVLAGTFGMAPLGSVTVNPGTVLGASPNLVLKVDVPDGGAAEGEGGGDPTPNGGEGSNNRINDDISGSSTPPHAGTPPFGPQPPAPGAGPGSGPGTGSAPRPGTRPGGPGGQTPPDDPGSLPGPHRPQPPGQEPPAPGPGQPGPQQPPPYSPEIPRPSTGVPLPPDAGGPVVQPDAPDDSDGTKKPAKGEVGRPGKDTKPAKPANPGKTVAKPAKPPKVIVKPVTPAKSGKLHKAGSGPKGKGPVIIVVPPKPAQDKDTGPKYRPPEPAQQSHPTDADQWQDAQPHPAHRDKAPKPAKARVAQTNAAVEPPSAPRPAPADRPTAGNGNGKGKSKGGGPQAAPAPPAAAVDTGRAAGGSKPKNTRGK